METYNRENIGRFYKSPKGDFPSVTTVLGAWGDSSWLDEWRERIGAEQADAITTEAANIGTHLHHLFECLFIEGKETPLEPKTPEEEIAVRMFKLAKPKLQKFVKKVLYMEEAVYSSEFRIAGRFDMLCLTVDDKIALVDYKNSRRAKTRKDIDSYRQQIAFYCKMIKETFGIDVDEQKIFMVTREGFVQVFTFYEKDTSRSELVAIRKNFWNKHGI